MPGEPEDDDVLLLTDEVEDEAGEQAAEQQENQDEGGDEDVVIAFEGDEEAEAPQESAVIRELRTKIRELQKERKANPAPKVEVGKKPDLWEDCEGDPDKFEAELLAYNKRVDAAKKQAEDADKIHEAATAEFEVEHATYREQKAKLAKPDFETAEIAIETALTVAQQSVLLLAAKQKAPLIYALGKNSKRLAEIAKITNPIKLAIAVNELERSLKVTPRKGVEPEEKQRGTGSMSTSAKDKEIEKLERQMQKGGDITEARKRLKELRAQ